MCSTMTLQNKLESVRPWFYSDFLTHVWLLCNSYHGPKVKVRQTGKCNPSRIIQNLTITILEGNRPLGWARREVFVKFCRKRTTRTRRTELYQNLETYSLSLIPHPRPRNTVVSSFGKLAENFLKKGPASKKPKIIMIMKRKEKKNKHKY